MKQLAEDVYQLKGWPKNAINVYLIGEVLIDAATRQAEQRIVRQIDVDAPGQGKSQQDPGHDQGRQPGHASALRRRVARRHRDERGHRRDRVDDHKERAGRENEVGEEGHAAGEEAAPAASSVAPALPGAT